MDNEPTIDVMLDDLEEASTLESSEQGEWWADLAAMRSQIADCATDEFRQAWEREVVDEYRLLKREYRIIEESRQRTETVRRLEYIC